MALLMAASVYLSGAIGTPQQQQAIDFASQAVVIAQQALTVQMTPVQEPIAIAPQSTSTQPIEVTQPSMKSLTIISPIPGKGLGREYIAGSQVIGEENYIELGLIVKDDAGNPIKDIIVEIEATDSTQNKTLNGTGTVKKIYDGEVPTLTPYYPFHYEFKTAGDHVITFKADGLIESVTLQVK